MPDEDRRTERAREQDRPALAAICLRTAAAGQDGTHLYGDPELPGQFWVLPYAALEPDLAFVLRKSGRVLGYVVGTTDTRAFAARLDRDWWPAVRTRYASFRPVADPDAAALRRLAEPEPPDERLSAHPAHLHVNLLPEAQRDDWGRRLIERELDALRTAGAAMVHLGVSLKNERVVAFYEKLGFQVLFTNAAAIHLGREV